MYNELTEIEDWDRQIGEALSQKYGKYVQLEESLTFEKERYAQMEKSINDINLAREYLVKFTNNLRQESKERIENFMTAVVRSMFGSDYEFSVELADFGGSRQRPNATFWLIKTIGDESIKLDPVGSTGGGVVDIITTTLRIMLSSMFQKEGERPFVMLDEPFAHLSPDKVYYSHNLIYKIAKMLGVQLIMISHTESAEGINLQEDILQEVGSQPSFEIGGANFGQYIQPDAQA